MKWFCFSWKTRIFHTWRWVLSLLSCTGVWDRLGSYYGLTCPLKCDRGKQLIFLKLLHSLYLPQRASVRNSWNNVWCVAQRFADQPINSRYSSKKKKKILLNKLIKISAVLDVNWYTHLWLQIFVRKALFFILLIS